LVILSRSKQALRRLVLDHGLFDFVGRLGTTARPLGEGSLDDIVGYPPSIDEWLDTYCIALTPQELARYRSHPIDQAMVEKQVGIKMCRNSALSVARAKAMASAEH